MALFCSAAPAPDTRCGAGRAGGSPPVGSIDITCISPNGFVLPPCRRRLAKPATDPDELSGGNERRRRRAHRLMRSVKSRTGLQPPSLSRVSIAPTGRIGKQSLVYPRYSCRRRTFKSSNIDATRRAG